MRLKNFKKTGKNMKKNNDEINSKINIEEFISHKEMTSMIQKALKEDLGSGDVSTLAIIDNDRVKTASIIARQRGSIAGLPMLIKTFESLDSNAAFTKNKNDGDTVEKNEVIIKIEARIRALLAGERTALNFLGRLSGIATASSGYAALVKNKHLKILDTRKTIPLYRSLEKYAVKTGGCHNHRMGLYDMIMLKENHIKAAGSILEAVKKCRAKYPNLKIEVETTDLEEVKEAVRAGSSIVMFDNMNDSEIIKALEITKNNCLTEASGNMDENRITALADTGLDYISVGSLTHSVQVFDFSMILN